MELEHATLVEKADLVSHVAGEAHLEVASTMVMPLGQGELVINLGLVRYLLSMDHDLLPLARAAELLGVSAERVRQLVIAGDLPGIRLGDAWAVPGKAVVARRHQTNRRGRPLGARRAWEELRAGPVDLGAVSRYRNRASIHRGRLPRGDLAFVADHPSVRVSGVAAAVGYGEPLVDDPASAVLYLPASVQAIVSESVAFVEDGLGPVVLAVVDDSVWPLVSPPEAGSRSHRLVPPGAVAVDLMASDDPRHWSAAEHLVRADG